MGGAKRVWIRICVIGWIVSATGLMQACQRGSVATQPVAAAVSTQVATPRPFEQEVQALLQRDRQTPPPTGAIVCVGSSSMVGWKTLERDMAPLPVLNRAFGGSTTAHQLLWCDELIVPLRPRVILYYCGDNDLAADGCKPATAVQGFVDFAHHMRRRLPDVTILYVSIKPSPARAQYWPQVQAANAAIRRWCIWQPRVVYVDVATPMLDAQGGVRTDLFSPDALHMNPAGYALWTEVIRPRLERTWQRVGPRD